MMDESIPRNSQPEAGRTCPAAIIIVFEVADAKPFIEQTDLFHNFTTNEQAESDEPVGLAALAVVRFAPSIGETLERPTPLLRKFVRLGLSALVTRHLPLVRHVYLLRPAHEIGHGSYHAHFWTVLECPQQAREPACGDDRVIVEQQELLAGRRLNPLIRRGRKPAILCVRYDGHP